ncbi:unnamed protein product [Mytilus edulis]|uniref:Uncharacterized protein n=1 Tax=Mytilus edulis TaxID=6550 RepID=A0A8S3SX79_MYTED|nr:unnamed protein product [Mytilus edulis]
MVSRKSSQADKELSLWFYQYCCRVIGKKKVVKTKRQICNAIDHVVNLDKRFLTRIGGSIAEGLGLKSSDYDMSLIINTGTLYHIYEHDTDINTKRELIPLALQTDDTKPGYTKLKLMDKSREKECSDYLESLGDETFFSSENFVPKTRWKESQNENKISKAYLDSLFYAITAI